MIRKLNLGDLVRLERFAKFPMPKITNPNYVIQWALLSESGELIGAAFVKKTCEISMIMDETINKVTRTKAWLEAFDLLDQVGPTIGFDDVHAFVLGDNACTHSMLMKKLGFVPAIGIPLYYEIGSSEWLRDTEKKRLSNLEISPQDRKNKLKKDFSEAELLVLG